MPERFIEIVKGFGLDVFYVMGLFFAWLPDIQGVLGVFVTLTILLINLKRYKTLLKNGKQEKEKG